MKPPKQPVKEKLAKAVGLFVVVLPVALAFAFMQYATGTHPMDLFYLLIGSVGGTCATMVLTYRPNQKK